ncbi:hypothetical protein KKE19_00875 [Patescibacteria group bacterium]|nr:hypothetical protein [Patescibacteria group bacterium]MBU4367545.1 hypothetical protein [Patescibacteria group bacterium]MBU4461586.1 hypothetical protein [Patescibacteria group bacterium]MCG2699483.1 hypothetical protein [Candidatus Parcubacteria bacterium]
MNKKILFLFLIALVVLPQFVNAKIFTDKEWSWWDLLFFTWRHIIPDIPKSVTDNLFNALIFGFSILYMGISWLFATLGDILFSAVIKISSGYMPDNNEMVKAGWTIVRDIANMIIVLGFVAVAIATILRMKEYQAQKLLAPLIIVAILINFSPVICGVIIDASNIATKHFLGTGRFYTIPAWETQWGALKWDKGPVTNLMISMSYTFFNIMAGFVLFLFFFLFTARHIMLMILVIFSPIAFVCYIFPFTKQYFKMWWNNFLQWCIIGIPAGFTLYLASNSIKIMAAPSSSVDIGGVSLFQDFFEFLLPGCIMIIGFLFTLQSSAIGAAIGISVAKAVGRGSLKAGKAVGSKALGKDSKIGQKLGDWKTGAQERMGWISPGTLTQKQEKRGKEASARADADYAQNPDKVVSRAGARGLRPGLKREDIEASAVKAAQEGKLIFDPSNAQYNPRAVANYRAAVASGFDVKEAEKKNPELRRLNDRKVNELMQTTPGLNRTQAEDRAVSDSYAKLSVGEIRNLSDIAVNINLIRNVSAKKISKSGEEMSQAKIDKLKSYLGDIRAMRYAAGSTTPTGRELTDKINAIDSL